MDSSFEPTPEPEGRLGPPGRKPPTAVGTATPPPPRPRGTLPPSGRWDLWLRVIAPVTIAAAIGATLGIAASPPAVRAVGGALAGIAILFLLRLSWAVFVLPRLEMWREQRWLRRKRHAC